MYELMMESKIFRTKNDFKRFDEEKVLYAAALHMMAVAFMAQEANITDSDYDDFIVKRANYWRQGFDRIVTAGGDLHAIMYAISTSDDIVYRDGESLNFLTPQLNVPHIKRFFTELSRAEVSDSAIRVMLLHLADDFQVNDSNTKDAIRRIRNMRNLKEYDAALVGNFIRMRMERLNMRTDIYHCLVEFLKSDRVYDVERYAPRNNTQPQQRPHIVIGDDPKPKSGGSFISSLVGLGAGFMAGQSYFNRNK